MIKETDRPQAGGKTGIDMNFAEMSPTERQILVFSFYRDAELRGARLLFNLLGRLKSAEAQLKMSRHLADETRHAWLWTKRISELGGTPALIDDGYQRRLGMRTGVPKSVIDLLALTVIVEERAQSRYMTHLARPNVDPATREVLKAVTEDETWHLAWIEGEMRAIAAAEGDEQRAEESLERYRAIDREVFASLEADELAMSNS
jgi:bacterioferritin (cytochrome b1)